MAIVLVGAILFLMMISLLLAFWGPRTWLKVSALTAFLLGIALGLLGGYQAEDFYLGLCCGVVLMIFIVFSGLSVRRSEREGMKVIKDFWKSRKQKDELDK